MMIVKNRSLNMDKEPESAELKKHVLLKDRTTKQLVLTRNEDYMVQEQPVPKHKVVLSWDSESSHFEIVED